MVFVTDDHEGIFMYGTTNQAGSMDMNFVGICVRMMRRETRAVINIICTLSNVLSQPANMCMGEGGEDGETNDQHNK